MYIVKSSIRSSRWLTVLSIAILGFMLSTSACTGYVRDERSLQNDISEEFLGGQVAIYDLGIAEEYSGHFDHGKLLGQVRLVSDEEPENFGVGSDCPVIAKKGMDHVRRGIYPCLPYDRYGEYGIFSANDLA